MSYETALERAISDQILIIASRKEPRITQGELAEAVGVTRESMNKYLRGKTPMPLPVLIAVCEYLGVSIPQLVTRAEAQIGQ